jgi:uncharacterized RDD family membrane protein YckC
MEERPVNFSEKAPITLNLDEFDLDSFELKPINKGLGFHDEQKREKVVSRSVSKVGPTLRQATKASPSLSGNKFLHSTPQAMASSGLMNGVEAIYGSHEKLTRQEDQKVKKEKTQLKLKEASYLSMALAFVIDLTVVTSTTTLLLASFYALGFTEFNVTGLMNFITDSSIFALLFFSLTFLSYFSLLEPVGTIGKRLLSLRVCHSASRKTATIRQSFTRSLVTLMSLGLAGIPLILDFQGKLSDSRVIQQ